MFIKTRTLRKPEPEKMDSAIGNWLKANELTGKFLATKVLGDWKELVGATVAKHTKKVLIEKKVLMIYVDNAPLRHQLNMSKIRLVQLVNEKAGTAIVTDCLVL